MALDESGIAQKLLSKKRYEEALPHALRAFQLEKSERRCNEVARIYEGLHYPEIAIYYYRKTKWIGTAADPLEFEEATKTLEEIEPRLAVLLLTRASPSTGEDLVHVWVDGVAHPVETLPVLVFIQPGKQKLTIRDSGGAQVVEVTGEAGSFSTITLRTLLHQSRLGALLRAEVDPSLRGVSWAAAGTFRFSSALEVAGGAFFWPASGQRIFGGSLDGTLRLRVDEQLALGTLVVARLLLPDFSCRAPCEPVSCKRRRC